MLNKLKQFFGLDELEPIEPTTTNGLIELRTIQAENRELREIIKKQRSLLQEFSEQNMELGRDRRRYADTVATQKRIIDVYESHAG